MGTSEDVGGFDQGLAARTQACCERIGEAAESLGVRVAVAESLTGGSVAARLAATEGSSRWLIGGIVAYASSVKHAVLGVPEGPVVSAEAAVAMSEGVAALLSADVALSITGVAGPGEQDGKPVGTVFFGVRDRHGATAAFERHFVGAPREIVEATLVEALDLLAHRLASSATDADRLSSD
jgi:nicotinamide-nucleotide amidase